MNNPAFIPLPQEALESIKQALRVAIPSGPSVSVDTDSVIQRGTDLYVAVRPDDYPSSMFDFLQAVAGAEVALRDHGLKVKLIPDIRQRMLVVGRCVGRPEIAFLSEDGKEYADLADAYGISEADLAAAEIHGYPYDNEIELEAVVAEAKQDHAGADFSHIP